MRIISKFRDYYDSITISEYPTYNRVQEEHLLRTGKQISGITNEDVAYLNKMYNDLPSYQLRGRVNKFKIFVVGFCGEVFPVYGIYKTEWSSESLVVCVDYDDMVDTYEKVYNESLSTITKKLFVHRQHDKVCRENIDQWKKQYNNARTYNIFITIGCPIFIIQGHDYLTARIETNSNLSDINFQRIVNPYQAYQSIEQFLSNDLAVTQEKTPDFGDVLKRDAHGFDNWSFKQVGPKPRKRKNKGA